MKRLIFLLLAAFTLGMPVSGRPARHVEVVKPAVRAASQFAVFIDARNFAQCRDAVMAYKRQLESEGLATVILAADWTSPEMVKAEIGRLAASSMPLEGMVFVGDIPIARIRKAQHFTTAFKMNQKAFPMIESSVTSDRFYDTPSLKFEYIGKDDEGSGFFYYDLKGDCPQYLDPAYYSARILVPEQLLESSGKTEKEFLDAFFAKAVQAHKSREVLDNMAFFAGHGYNSDCMTVWMNFPLVFREHFPEAFQDARQNRFMDFRQGDAFKYTLFSELQRPGTDIFLFYEHGSPDVQYINGPPMGTGVADRIAEIQRSIVSAYDRCPEAEREAFRKDVLEHFHFTEELFAPETLEHYRQLNGKISRDMNISLEDISRLQPASRVTIFNACYNGSFHAKGYVAGYHLFNGGQTVVTQGNTVNVLQDKWEDELMGLLGLGARAGFWQKEVSRLESHLLGDPTFRFHYNGDLSPEGGETEINALLQHPRHDVAFWKKYALEHSNPVLRALGVKRLLQLTVDGHAPKTDISQLLAEIYDSDPSWTVRCEAITALSVFADENFRSCVAKGLLDEYEFIRRQCAHWAGKTGCSELVPVLEKLSDEGLESQRVMYAAASSIRTLRKDRHLNLHGQKGALISEIRATRNNPSAGYAQDYLQYIPDASVDMELRLNMAEAIGWYNYYPNRREFVKGLEKALETIDPADSQNAELIDEVNKSIRRLSVL